MASDARRDNSGGIFLSAWMLAMTLVGFRSHARSYGRSYGRSRSTSGRRAPALACGILFAALMTACASGQWERPGASAQDVERDLYQCEREAAQMYPPHMVENTYGSSTTTTEECKETGGKLKCTSKTVAPTKSVSDANDMRRDSAQRSCMRSRAYRWRETD